MGDKRKRTERIIKRGLRRWISVRSLLLLFIGGILIFVSLFLDNDQDCKMHVYQVIKNLLPGAWEDGLRSFREIVKIHICDYGSMVINYNAILMAAVIFFYSVSDNIRIGIPYKTIISYSIGSLSIPILFFVSMVLSLFFYYIEGRGFIATYSVCVVYALSLQIVVIIEILWSISIDKSIRVVCRIEKKRYEALKVLGGTFNAILYVPRHMERVFICGELTSDKVRLARRLLDIPLYNLRFCKKRKWKNEKWFKCELEFVYNFYYENIVAVMHHFCGEDNRDTRNIVYMMLYEFLNELQGERIKCVKSKSAEKNMYYERLSVAHAMIISGIMNAMQFCDVDEADFFCNHVLNYSIENEFNDSEEDENIKMHQLNLYILFQEMRFAISSERLCHLDTRTFGQWKEINNDDIPELAFFWNIWGKQYSLSVWKKGVHFINAIHTMLGYGNLSKPISCIMGQLLRKRREYVYNESNDYSVD